MAGRSSFERRQVVTSYLRAKKFLRWMEAWKRGDEERLMKSLDLGWEIPVFFWFHLLCPEDAVRSAVVLNGDLNRVWGDTSLAAHPTENR